MNNFECRWCKNMYKPRSHNHVYCSVKCRQQARKFEYWELKKAGLCVTCREPVDDDYVRCARCLSDRYDAYYGNNMKSWVRLPE